MHRPKIAAIVSRLVLAVQRAVLAADRKLRAARSAHCGAGDRNDGEPSADLVMSGADQAIPGARRCSLTLRSVSSGGHVGGQSRCRNCRADGQDLMAEGHRVGRASKADGQGRGNDARTGASVPLLPRRTRISRQRLFGVMRELL